MVPYAEFRDHFTGGFITRNLYQCLLLFVLYALLAHHCITMGTIRKFHVTLSFVFHVPFNTSLKAKLSILHYLKYCYIVYNFVFRFKISKITFGRGRAVGKTTDRDWTIKDQEFESL
jgi:hypothetical protein